MKTEQNNLIAPFLKWAGGKRQLLPEIQKNLPVRFNYYFEPFIGGGALLFSLKPKKAVINDINEELINVYEVIRDKVDALIKNLKKHENNPEYYYKERDKDRGKNYKRLSKVERASRIIYLNKTCYNGLFRVNSRGYFNVPFGRYKNPNIVNEAILKAVSNYFNGADIKFYNIDFQDFVENIIIKKIKKDTFVYLDPPYHPVSQSSSFTGYSLDGFNEEDQIRLRQSCDRLVDKGCKILLSNSYTDFIKKLYKDRRYKIIEIKATRNINSIATMRGKISEALIRSY